MTIEYLINAVGQPNNGFYEGKTKYNFNCPKCAEQNLGRPDNKYNLGVLLESNNNIFNCWKCGYKGRVKTLLKDYGKKQDYDAYVFYNMEDYTDVHQVKKQNYLFTNLPKDFISFEMFDIVNNENHKKAYDYLVYDRKIPIRTIKFYKLGACFEGFFKDRIIIPSYDKDNKLNFFVGRTFIKDLKPTYLHNEVDKTTFIFNEFNINWNHPIYLVEGAFDMLSLPINTISLNGKILLDNILQKLIKYKSYVVLILDDDANKESLAIKQKLDLYDIKNKVIFLKNKDLNKMLKDDMIIKKNVMNYRNLLEE